MAYKLYHYWRSSSSWRVRWALSYKSLDCEMVAIDLLDSEQKSQAHLKRNPTGFVPVLAVEEKGETHFLAESSAIIEFLEETHPEQALLPTDALGRAHVRRLVQIVNAATQPLQNLQVLKFYSEDAEQKKKWAQHWIRNGLQAYEDLVKSHAQEFSAGSELSMADLFLIPQLYNARRFDIDVADYPCLSRIEENAKKIPSYQKSHPDVYAP